MENQEFNNAPQSTDIAPVMSLKDWVISILITCIPIVGIIMLIIWAFSGNEINQNKRNWAKAFLIIQVVGFILVLILYALIFATIFAVYNSNMQ